MFWHTVWNASPTPDAHKYDKNVSTYRKKRLADTWYAQVCQTQVVVVSRQKHFDQRIVIWNPCFEGQFCNWIGITN
jgi:hypothetical protein